MKTNVTLTRRLFLQSMAGLGSGLALAACTPTAQPASAPASTEKQAAQPPASKPKITVKIQTPATVNTMDMVNKCIAEFMDKNPDVQVVSEETIYGEIATKTETGYISGTLQDICYGQPLVLLWLRARHLQAGGRLYRLQSA